MFQTAYLWWSLPFWFCVPSPTYVDYWQMACEHHNQGNIIPNFAGC
jgi:hypothetical protein